MIIGNPLILLGLDGIRIVKRGWLQVFMNHNIKCDVGDYWSEGNCDYLAEHFYSVKAAILIEQDKFIFKYFTRCNLHRLEISHKSIDSIPLEEYLFKVIHTE